MRFPALQGKRDANEPEIIKALEAVGATVDQNPIGKGRPDLDVGFRGENYKQEVKMPGCDLNKAQVYWHNHWEGQVDIVRTPQEALEAIGYYDDEPLDCRCRREGL
jgi:hypothetical protein